MGAEVDAGPPSRARRRHRANSCRGGRAKSERSPSSNQAERSFSGITRAEAVPLNRVMLTSPFNERLKYNAYAALRVLAAHQRRHIWQAERALRGIP